ncbi:MAG: 23S rRNA (uracil(1939)-C(5))-methyltransferase RlmD [Lachnospiraceae bacterium]|nr:23S rRNA (uracil(1939)-C(5))-methyltransferase RlmD [Lachnospiraceae bacterium]
MEYVKNQVLTVSIDDIGSNGEGIGKHEGYTLFVKDAVCGDTVKARLTKIKKNYAFARLEEVIEPSKSRTEPFCENHIRCGGCQIQAMSYPAQLAFKENKVRNDLIRIGGIPESIVEAAFEPIAGMPEPVRYRNKAQYPIGKDRDGNTVAGFYAGRTHSIIPCIDCMLSPNENKDILEIILTHMRENHIEPYDETTGEGTVRHVLIRKGFATGQIMVCLILNLKGQKRSQGQSVYLPGQKELIERLCTVTKMTSICVSINNENTNVIMGNEIRTIWGRDKITDILLGKSFEISPLSFYQVNPVQVEKLYGTAIEFAGLTGSEEVWDLCCGIGTISICMADKARIVHGLEIVPEAIEDAKQNALANKADNTDFICAAAEEYLPAHKDEIKADVIVLDPPRKGMEEAALAVIADASPSRIVYVSCDSTTLARDIKYLRTKGYEISRVRCTDMFPHTVHIEVCCLLE